MQLTDEQLAIVDAGRGKDDILIEAVAGSGKTSALLATLDVMPQRSILVTAYNARIADELVKRAPRAKRGSAIHIKTFHAVGRQIVLKHFPGAQFDRSGTDEIIAAAAGEASLAYPLRRAAVRLLQRYKETMGADTLVVAEPEELLELGHNYDLFGKLTAAQVDHVVDVAARGYELSFHPETFNKLDFCDMLWLPMALNLAPPSRYQAIVVDEWQDINIPQLELIRRLCLPSTRLIMAGDGHQAINAWRGAVAGVVRQLMCDERKAKVMTLTISFRCSKAVIDAARALVPEVRALPDALEGSVTTVGLRDVPRMIIARPSDEIHTFVLSRNNAALLDTALLLWREGVRFQLNAGQEMLAPLFELLDKLDLRTPDLFRKSLKKWHAEALEKAETAGSIEQIERVNEQHSMLHSAVSYVAPTGLRKLLNTILEVGKTGVLLSTVHKVKGLEADRVFLLKQTFNRHKAVPVWQRVGGDEHGDERIDYIKVGVFKAGDDSDEANIEYVAITRAKEHLIWVNMPEREHEELPAEPLIPQMLASLTDAQLAEEFEKAEGELMRYSSMGEQDKADHWAKYAKLIAAEQSKQERAR
jgi:superfamily I DNA/RNA helicase